MRFTAPFGPRALLPVLAGTPLTVNQQSVATAFDRAIANGADASAFFNLFLLPASSLPAALDQLSGQVHTGTEGLGILVSGQFLSVMLDPFALGRAPGTNPALVCARCAGGRSRHRGGDTGRGSAGTD